MIIDIYSLKQLYGFIKIFFNFTKWGPKIIYFWNYFFSKPYCVIVYGATGVGKTEFCRSLLERNLELTESPRTVLHQIEILVLKDGHKIKLYDLPGHVSYKANRDRVIELMAKQKVYGIINVVSYGYHEVQNAQNLKTFKVSNGEDVLNIDTQFQKDNLQREYEQAKEWRTGANLPCNLGWIITVVNKADIWFNKRDEILDYYQKDGNYSKSIFGDFSTRVRYVYPYCSIISPFCKKPMLLELGERTKLEMHNKLKDDLLRLIKNEI